MQTIVKTSSGISVIPIEARLLADRKVFLEGEITYQSACEFVRQIMLLCGENPDKPIDVYIDSPGGEVNAGLLIYDTLKGCRTEINLFCIGMCASMAAIILASGQRNRRFATPHSRFLLHEPLLSGGFAGSASSIQRTAESIMETKRIIAELLAKDTGKAKEEIDKAIAFDNYLNAEEAVAFGLCDRIITSIV